MHVIPAQAGIQVCMRFGSASNSGPRLRGGDVDRGSGSFIYVVSVNARYNSRARCATGPAAISCASKRVHGVTFP